MEEGRKVIDVEKAIKEGDSKLFKSLPKFIIKLIIRIVRQDQLNYYIIRNEDKTGVPFINSILHDWNVTAEGLGMENVPASGRYVFVANHPVGAMDALSFLSTIYKMYPDVVSPANELLGIIPNLRPVMLELNVFGKSDRETVIQLDRLFESDTTIMIFPAGEVSRRRKRKILDPVWQKSFITKAIQHKRDIIPAYITGRNSNLFYIVANLRKRLGIKVYVETMLLPREMFNQRNSTTYVTFDKPIPYQTFTNDKTHAEWAQWVKEVVYSIPDEYSTGK